MKGVVLKQDEVKQLQDTGTVTVWRDVPQKYQHAFRWTPADWRSWSNWNVPEPPKHFVPWRKIADHDSFPANAIAIISEVHPSVAPGEVRFVRETFMFYHTDGDRPGVWYKVDKSEFVLALNRELGHRWSSPVTMPEWASRYTVTVTAVTVEKRGDVWQWKIELEKVNK